jgi:hypothetical protein
MEELFDHETFSRHLKTTFQAQLDESNHVDLELTEVSNLKRLPQQEEFSIVFLGPGTTDLGQGTRLLKHEQMGQFELFIVPIARDQKGIYYEAAFNRKVENNPPPSANSGAN